MIVNCDIPLPQAIVKKQVKVMLDLELETYSFYYKGHPATIAITDEHPFITSPIVREYYTQKEKQKARVKLLMHILLVSIIGMSAVLVYAYAIE